MSVPDLSERIRQGIEEAPNFTMGFLAKITIAANEVLHSKVADEGMAKLHELLGWVGVPPPYISVEEFTVMILTFAVTFIGYYIAFGRKHQKERIELASDLEKAKKLVGDLEDKLMKAEISERRKSLSQNPTKEIRVWMDGAFDMMHFGHMNAFRQGRALGTKLIVGINSDASIRKCKGTSPVMSDSERTAAVAGCKFVDEVVEECPYVLSPEYLRDVVFGKYNCDIVVHGDDPCYDVHGNDVYAESKRLGRFRSIPRTEGVSTTDIVGRMLMGTKTHHTNNSKTPAGALASASSMSNFLTTNRMVRAFSAETREPKPTDKIVYVDGCFDMFHAGHVAHLKNARAEGTYLIVGVYGDAKVNAMRGGNMPIMNANERVLSVLGCRHVDDVLIDPPLEISEQMIKSLNISLIVHGTKNDNICDEKTMDTWYKVPQKMGMMKKIKSKSGLNVHEVIDRIMRNEAAYSKKIAAKKKKEEEYYKERFGLDGDDESKKLK